MAMGLWAHHCAPQREGSAPKARTILVKAEPCWVGAGGGRVGGLGAGGAGVPTTAPKEGFSQIRLWGGGVQSEAYPSRWLRTEGSRGFLEGEPTPHLIPFPSAYYFPVSQVLPGRIDLPLPASGLGEDLPLLG